MLLKIILIGIIIFILFSQYFEYSKNESIEKIDNVKPINYIEKKDEDLMYSGQMFVNNKRKSWEFDRPNPWTRIIFKDNEEFPYYYYIKINIPSLNDYQAWKQVVPNLDFSAETGELIIPSKDEPSALALANLIIINFTGQMTLENILEKDLIQISINKAKNYDLIQTKLREQINENLYNKSFNKTNNNFEKDLVEKYEERVDFTSETFTDTFQHFDNSIDNFNNIGYSYL